MDRKALLKELKLWNDVEHTLELLAEEGGCPCLLNNDDGYWALSFDGMQNVPSGEKKEDVAICCFIEADDWQKTIYDAVVYKLEKTIKE